ncbi:MAG: hypothetical protein ACK5N4_25580, partial [Parabacteroides gordonii]|uniref:hypothetical protein n=1 Tax=Parabacteroides gordonii TaxID=574930 RepID=UPI003A8AC9EF
TLVVTLASFLANVDAKIRTFISYFQMFSEVFLKSFFHHVLQCRSLSNADAKVVLYNIHSKLYSHYFLLKIAPNTLLF